MVILPAPLGRAPLSSFHRLVRFVRMIDPVPGGPDLPPLPLERLTIRLAGSQSLRRMFPRQAAYALLWLLNERLWRRSPQYRDECGRSMSYLLAKSPRAKDADGLAKRYGYEALRRSELLWRPWVAGTLPIDGAETLRAAQLQGRGVLLNFSHHGLFHGIFASLRREGFDLYVAAAPGYFEPPGPGYQGRRDRQHILNVMRGSHVFDAARSSPYIRELLAAGEIVALAFDMPGTAETVFLGRRVYAAPGLARTAKRSGALIVPVTMHRHRDLARLRVEQPLDPDDYETVEELHAAVVTRHEPGILAWPEAFEFPLRRWTEMLPVG